MKKNNFYFGLITGAIIIALIISLSALGVYFYNKIANPSSGTANLYSNNDKESSPADIKVDLADHIRGDFDAPVTIVEYSDFQCPYCFRFGQTMEQIMEEYPNDVRWVYRHFPLSSSHPYAQKAAEASECAADQNKFWQYHDQLFSNQSQISPSFLPKIAQTLDLDMDQFSQCLDSGKYSAKVKADYQEGLGLGVEGTPGNFINGEPIGGALPYEQIKEMIDNLLSNLEK